MTEPREPVDPRSADEQWLDRMLDAAPKVEPSATLRRAVAEIPLRHPRPEGAVERGWGFPSYALRLAVLAALVSVAAGAWLGAQADVWPEVAIAGDEGGAAGSEDAWEELALLAFADELDTELSP